MKSKLINLLSQKKYLYFAAVTAFIYAVIYLYATQFLTFSTSLSESLVELSILPRWQSLVFRQRQYFIYESIGSLQIGSILFFISPLNLIITTILSLLVSLNFTISFHSLSKLHIKNLKGAVNLFGAIPSLLSGAACCGPTVLAAIGLQLTSTVTTLWSLITPLSIVFLTATLYWSLSKLRTTSGQKN